MLGVPPRHPVQQHLHEVRIRQQVLHRIRPVRLRRASTMRVAREGDQQHLLYRTVEAVSYPSDTACTPADLHRNREGTPSTLHRLTQELLAPVHPHHPRQATDQTVGLGPADRRAQRRQHRVPGRLVRRERHPDNHLRRNIDEPRHPRTHHQAFEIHTNRDPLVVPLPTGVPVRGRALAVHVIPAPRRLTPTQTRPLPRRQIASHRPLHRRQRRHHLHIPGRPGLSNQLPVHRRHVPAPHRQKPPHVRRDREIRPRQRPHPALGTSRRHPTTNRTHRHTQPLGHQTHMRRRQPTPASNAIRQPHPHDPHPAVQPHRPARRLPAAQHRAPPPRTRPRLPKRLIPMTPPRNGLQTQKPRTGDNTRPPAVQAQPPPDPPPHTRQTHGHHNPLSSDNTHQ